MRENYLTGLVKREISTGLSNEMWWDEERIPLDSVDKSVAQLLNLEGKKAVVIGGAGLNLGQACVNRLAGLGADVAVVDRDAESARESGRMRWTQPPDAAGVASAARDKWGTDVFPLYGDAMDWDEIHRILRECNDRMGRIDILVNSAADAVMGPFETYTKEQIDRTVLGSFVGPVYATRAVLDYMIPQGGGRIINIGSESSQTMMPQQVMYGASKMGLQQFTRFAGKELAAHGVHLLGVNPGSMWGPDRPFDSPVDFGLYAMGRTGLQRYELPEEVANMVAFLASDAASAMVGEVVNMGGGMGI